MCTNGSAINTRKESISITLPVLCSHLLTPSPRPASVIKPAIMPTFNSMMKVLFVASHAPLGPTTYDRFVPNSRPTVARNTTA